MSDTSEPHRVESALTRKAEAEHLIDQVAHDVVPGANVRAEQADIGPSQCTSPLKGQVYYTIQREFDAPSGKTGADLVPALRAAFEHHGMQTENQETVGDRIRFTGGTDYVGFAVLAYNTSRLVQINLDTECGSPESSTPNTATAP
ncbi:MAG TPA: hypothetical protein VFT67_16900 [Jatrophihabitantaceae bacterium]|nr:hypothetical protein [Jatrophihabitantaceae bacterium]